jgi:hypothetical protein
MVKNVLIGKSRRAAAADRRWSRHSFQLEFILSELRGVMFNGALPR